MSGDCRRTLVLAVGALVLAGCHTYRVVDTAPTGATVRVLVPVRSALDGPNQAPRTAAIEGQLVSWSDSLTLTTRTRQEYGAYREVFRIDTLRISPSQTSAIELREFSSGRSILLGSVIAATAGFAAIYAFDTNRDPGTPPGGGGGEPPALSIDGRWISSLLRLLGG